MASDLFGTVISVLLAPGSQELIVALGRTTIINITSPGNVTLTGIFSTTGNVDGMVVCLSNLNNNSFQVTCAHESLAANAVDRFRNAGLTDVSGGTGAGGLWYRYNGSISRFVNLGRTA